MDSLGKNGDFGSKPGTDGDRVVENRGGDLGWIVHHHVETGGIMTTSAFHVFILGEDRRG